MLAQQHYGMEYLKKIVQVEFCIPEFDREVKRDSGYFFTMYFTHRMNKNLGNQNTVEEFISLCNRKDT